MRFTLSTIITVIIFIQFSCCVGQNPSEKKKKEAINTTEKMIVGGPFENGEFMYIGQPKQLKAIDTSPGWKQKGQKILITGKILKPDGKTPAPNVILYYYHTDIRGYYSADDQLDKRVAKHGYIRGWVKSDSVGNYSIYSVRPGAYPNSREPAHIHPSIKEPGIEKEYYLDGFVFDDDPLLTTAKRNELSNRGGTGILRLLKKGDLQVAEHNIILGLNIPNYPIKLSEVSSGKSIGEDVISFTPNHAWGPDKGSKACPVCKYGRYHGILYFVGNNPNWTEIKQWLLFLESESHKRPNRLKAYFIYGNANNYNNDLRIKELEEIGEELNLQDIALTFVPSFADESSDIDKNKIDPKVESTILIYKHSTIIDKFVNSKPTQASFEKIRSTLNTTTNEFFQLPTIHQK